MRLLRPYKKKLTFDFGEVTWLDSVPASKVCACCVIVCQLFVSDHLQQFLDPSMRFGYLLRVGWRLSKNAHVRISAHVHMAVLNMKQTSIEIKNQTCKENANRAIACLMTSATSFLPLPLVFMNVFGCGKKAAVFKSSFFFPVGIIAYVCGAGKKVKQEERNKWNLWKT